MLLRGVNDSADDLLDLCFTLLDEANILPYYFYLCDLIPNAEHWRLPVSRRPRSSSTTSWAGCPGSRRPGSSVTCPSSVSGGSTRSPSTTASAGISYWTKNYRTPLDRDLAGDVRSRRYPYYDPIDTLPAAGQQWWARHAPQSAADRTP